MEEGYSKLQPVLNPALVAIERWRLSKVRKLLVPMSRALATCSRSKLLAPVSGVSDFAKSRARRKAVGQLTVQGINRPFSRSF